MGKRVVSLFDGMSCGLQALKELGVDVSEYHAFEIDKYAIQIAKKNHPEIIHHGSVEGFDFTQFKDVDIVMGGSPCQGFSMAGKGLAFDDPRSKLFFEFVRALKEIKPKNFLLENVKMKKEYLNIITEHMGVEPVLINSAKVSAQNRQRYYWCNWEVEQPEDRGILLKDVLESEVDEKYYLKDNWLKWWDENKDFQLKKKYSSLDSDKAITMTARQYASWNGNFVTDKPVRLGHFNSGGKGGHTGLYKVSESYRIRKLTPIECERLQTLPDNYSEGVSNTQRYKMLGNGWTVEVIKHLFRELYGKRD